MGSKFCNICSSSSPDRLAAWLRPCLCEDAGAEVHLQCLLLLVQKKENDGVTRGSNIYCGYCGVRFRIEPEKGPVVRVLEAIDRKWYPKFCQAAIHVCGMVFVDVSTATFGLLVLHQVLGGAVARDLVQDMDPVPAVALCQVIPYFCVLVNSLPWEERLLHVLRRCSNVPIIGRVLPLEDISIQAPSTKGNIRLFDIVMGGLLLPIYARVVGDLFFKESTPGTRFLLGGAVFICLKGFLTAYYKQKNYTRESQLTVVNYLERSRDNAT